MFYAQLRTGFAREVLGLVQRSGISPCSFRLISNLIAVKLFSQRSLIRGEFAISEFSTSPQSSHSCLRILSDEQAHPEFSGNTDWQDNGYFIVVRHSKLYASPNEIIG